MKYTKADIEKMANEIYDKMVEKGDSDFSIYFNGKRMKHLVEWDREKCEFIDKGKMIENDIDPHEYFEYAAYNHIFSMSFEGNLYEFINYYDLEGPKWLQKIFKKYGVYFELGEAWNFTVYPVNDNDEWEYTIYKEPEEEKIFSYYNQSRDKRLNEIANIWHSLMQYHKPCGSCIIGDGIHFKYEDHPYFMSTNYQQSDSPMHVIDIIRKELEFIGATEIRYDYGRMD